MIILAIVLVAFAPAVFWLWLILRGDRYAPEPRRLIIRTFFLGLAVAIPVALIETALYPGSIQNISSLTSILYLAFVVAGTTEEIAKFLVVRLSIYNNPRCFEEPSDGLVYSAAAALGLASLENVVYVLAFGFEVILIRGLFSNLSHVLFSAFWGYPLALYKTGKVKSIPLVISGLITAIIAHGVFDLLLFTGSIYTWLVIPFFLLMVAIFILLFRHANKISQYRSGNIKPSC